MQPPQYSPHGAVPHSAAPIPAATCTCPAPHPANPPNAHSSDTARPRLAAHAAAAASALCCWLAACACARAAGGTCCMAMDTSGPAAFCSAACSCRDRLSWHRLCSAPSASACKGGYDAQRRSSLGHRQGCQGGAEPWRPRGSIQAKVSKQWIQRSSLQCPPSPPAARGRPAAAAGQPHMEPPPPPRAPAAPTARWPAGEPSAARAAAAAGRGEAGGQGGVASRHAWRR